MNNIALEQFTRHIIRDELGIWQSEHAEKCHYPEDGAERLSVIEDKSFWFNHRRHCIIEMIKQHPPGEFIVDIGGGNGFISLGLMNAGFNAVLLEPSVQAVKNAHQRGLNNIICATLEQANFTPHSLPAVCFFDVLEHIEDDNGFLNTLKSILIPGGKLYLTVPAFQELWSVEDEYAKHFRRYYLDMLSQQLKTCGFHVDYATYMFSYLMAPLFLVKALPSKFGIAKRYTQDETRNEHVVQSKLTNKILEYIHSWESTQIQQGHLIPFGTSIMIAAHSERLP